MFSTRAPSRPNSIGISVVRLLGIEGRCLQVADLDIIDGTPLLDIKPFVPHFDEVQDIRTGWLESHSGRIPDAEGHDRFHRPHLPREVGAPVNPASITGTCPRG